VLVISEAAGEKIKRRQIGDLAEAIKLGGSKDYFANARYTFVKS